jgi:WD40 repeat protein
MPGGDNDNNQPPPNQLQQPQQPVPRKRGRKPKAEKEQQRAAAAAAASAAARKDDSGNDNNSNNNKNSNDVEMKKDVHDNPHTDDENDDEYKIKSNFNSRGYIQLPGYGDHKRAVSSVKFASSRLTKRSAVVASSSADGSIKLWDVQEAFVFGSSSTGSNSTSFNAGGGFGGSGSKRRNSTDNSNNDTVDGLPTAPTSGGSCAGFRRSSVGLGTNNEVTSTFVSGNNSSNNKMNHSSTGGASAYSNAKPMEPILQCMGHSRGINEIAWNPVAPLLASASDDKTVRLPIIVHIT